MGISGTGETAKFWPGPTTEFHSLFPKVPYLSRFLSIELRSRASMRV